MIWPRGSRPAFLVTGALAGLAFLLGDPAVQAAALSGWNLLALAMVAARAVREEKGHPARLMLLGFVVYTVANLAFFITPAWTGRPLPFPSLADGGLFVSYCVYGAVLVRVLRRRVAVRHGAFDIAIVAAGLSVPLWEFVVRPSLQVGVPVTATAATLMYPVMLTGLVAFALRLVFLAGFRGTPDLLLLGWVGGELGANVYLGVATAQGTYDVFSSWFLCLFFSYACLGFLALSPASAPVAAVSARGRASYGRLILLGGSLLSPLASLIVIGTRERSWYALAVAVVLTVAILVRLSTLTVDLDEQTGLLHDLENLAADLEHRSNHDALTGLPNRRLFSDRLDNALAQRVRGQDRGVALMLLDLDGFKTVNDTYGHDYGDQPLLVVADRLRQVCRDGDTVARLGGDEFAVLLPDADLAEALRVGDRIAGRLRLPIPLGDRELLVSASTGVVIAMDQDRSTLVMQADIAMYAAKRQGTGGIAVFDGELHSEVVARHELEIELRGAAARGELFLEYQPVLDLARHEMVAVEALIRWQHPVHGRIPPLQFIPLAEESGSIRQIGDWVMRRACEQLLSWDQAHPHSPRLGMAVNLSPSQILDGDLVSRTREILAQVGLDPQRVTLEVTETALDGDTEAMIGKLEQLKALGVELAIDDFGTGYSSLSFLRRLPVDTLKIDKSFVDGIAREPEEWALTTAIVKLATSLGKKTLAEGIELGAQLAHLRALNCQLGQGYLFDRPLPPEAIGERLETAARARAAAVGPADA